MSRALYKLEAEVGELKQIVDKLSGGIEATPSVSSEQVTADVLKTVIESVQAKLEEFKKEIVIEATNAARAELNALVDGMKTELSAKINKIACKCSAKESS